MSTVTDKRVLSKGSGTRLPDFDMGRLDTEHNWIGLHVEGLIVAAIPDVHMEKNWFDAELFGQKRYYIAGPMRGYDKWNFPAFDAAREFLLRGNMQAVSPADLDRLRGITEDTTDFDPEDFKAAMRIDTFALLGCTGIFMLKGWEKSTGAKYERMIADVLGLSVQYQLGAMKGTVALTVAAA